MGWVVGCERKEYALLGHINESENQVKSIKAD